MSTSPPRFCDACDNMMFCSLSEDQKIRYRCPNCEKEEVVGGGDGKKTHCVYSMTPKATKIPRENPHMAADPTLPRQSIKCSSTCASATPARRASSGRTKFNLFYRRRQLKYGVVALALFCTLTNNTVLSEGHIDQQVN